MPLESFEGLDVTDLEQAVVSVEKSKGRVVQVVGNFAGRWYLLTDKSSRAATGRPESRKAAS
jgi:hypothetical protein